MLNVVMECIVVAVIVAAFVTGLFVLFVGPRRITPPPPAIGRVPMSSVAQAALDAEASSSSAPNAPERPGPPPDSAP